ncbi:MAG: suppressor of fused domain protein, partial [Mycobacterium sp.]|nr:suppressor of fused domain protein [Mycobacterium sp.]
ADPDGQRLPFQIVRLRNGPVVDAVTFSTVGLGKIPLKCSRSHKIIRHELLMLACSVAVPPNLGPLLQQVAAEALAHNHPYLRGDVIGPRGSLFQNSTMTALYVSIPAYFPDDFGEVDGSFGPVIFAWLVPITNQEASFINDRGWDEFENELEKHDPDLIDFKRASIV